MLKVVNTLFRIYIGRYRRELREHYDNPVRIQQELLRDLLARNAKTAFGVEHGFDRILREPDTYADRVPIRTYEAHLPYLDRVLGGDRQVLTADEPDWLATTSGTTGAPKYLPYSNHAVREIHLKGSWMSLACLYEKDPEIQVFNKKNLLIGGAFKGIHAASGLRQGDISAIIIQSIPKVMRSFYIPDLDLATEVDYATKIEKIAQLAATEPGITILGGVPTWNLPLYRRILEISGAKNMVEVWPDARVFKHGGVNFAPYREQFEQLFPREDFIFQEIYNATEGFFGVQDKDDLRTMLLILNAGVYYEFITWKNYQQQHFKTAVSLSGVTTGEIYVMIITTEAGLYRYPMGDLIEFTETDPFRIRILGRTQEFINAFGEDLLRSEAEAALLEACKQTGALVREFTVAPVYIKLDGKGRHHWVVEFERAPADFDRFNDLLDVELQASNYNYKAKRSNDYAIGRHRLTVAPDGFFRGWLRARGKEGGQHKVPRLANHRRFLDDILARINE
ncbi:acyl-CoA synthetase (AMP-forming)/AMP-acid ligase II [Lewinella antarctica]|uniref:Acyl-CoA synthetase (AMP-forming)/AMP-acid ligase II n=2 Tax=Neolewinella antarctica TaxID=442734 RepID=A0ABX0X706_9BACT|nr:acyl-CoA synthetase (AMP-forming)/AMP-acid ligase II [Neolewinella antarctica]